MRRILLAALLLASGCAVKVYTPPTGDLGGYAKVSVRNLSAHELMPPRLYLEPFTCSDPAFFESPGKPLQKDEVKAYYARKGELTSVTGWYFSAGGGRISRCMLNLSFVATASEYQVGFEGDTGRCGAVILEGSGTRAVPLPEARLAVRGSTQPFAETGSWCEDLTPEQQARLGVKAPAPRPTKAAE